MADLDAEGITFEPLRSELADHLISDVESKIQDGLSFEGAFKIVKSQIPKNHFKHIQKETMEILSKKFFIVNLFVKVSVALLTLSAFFKLMHWPGASALLVLFMGVSAFTILLGSGRCVRVYREYKGRMAIWAIAILFGAFVIGLCFKVLHFPGAMELFVYSSIGIAILFPALSIYFYFSGGSLRDHLLVHLLGNNQRYMKHVALTLIGFGIILNSEKVFLGGQNYTGLIFFFFSVILVGMYTYAFTWKYFVENSTDQPAVKRALLLSSTLAFLLFMLPMFMPVLFGSENGIGFVIRQFAAFGALIIFDVIVCVHYAKFSDSPSKHWLAPLSTFLVFYPFVRLGIKLEWFEGFLGGLTTNTTFIIGFLVFLLVLYVRFRKEPLFSSLIILTMVSHMIPTL